jgi:hypothetical protein
LIAGSLLSRLPDLLLPDGERVGAFRETLRTAETAERHRPRALGDARGYVRGHTRRAADGIPIGAGLFALDVRWEAQ